MKTFTSIAFIGFVYASPVIAVLTVIAALFIASLIAEFLTARNAKDVELNQHYQDIKALFQSSDEIINKPVYQDDVWTDTKVTSCELACPISSTPNPVLALPQVQDVVIDYTTYSYKQLQQLCKQHRRKPSDIKLNSKRHVLQDWLLANA